MSGRPTVLEALQAAIARPLVPVSAVALADDPTGHLLPGIVTRVTRGGRFAPLAGQLNHDKSHLQGQRMQDVVGRLGNKVWEALAWLGMGRRRGRE